MENTIANMTYDNYLKVMNKTDSDSLRKHYKAMMSDVDNSQNWDLMNLRLNIFQQSRAA